MIFQMFLTFCKYSIFLYQITARLPEALVYSRISQIQLFLYSLELRLIYMNQLTNKHSQNYLIVKDSLYSQYWFKNVCQVSSLVLFFPDRN